jgi:hypothetical protein
MPGIAPDSPASGVSMKAQPTGCSRARFWICSVCSVNGNAYPGTLRKGPAETCMGSSKKIQEQARSGVWLPRSNPLNWERRKA